LVSVVVAAWADIVDGRPDIWKKCPNERRNGNQDKEMDRSTTQTPNPEKIMSTLPFSWTQIVEINHKTFLALNAFLMQDGYCIRYPFPIAKDQR
jgi:hypothetical protein